MPQSICSVHECELTSTSRGWCRKHYNAQYKGAAITEVVAMSECPICRKPFRSGSNRRYCSVECRESGKWSRFEKVPCSVCSLPTGYKVGFVAAATHRECRPIVHGTSGAYKKKCPCDTCKAYQAAVMRDYYSKLAKGETNAPPCSELNCGRFSAARGLCKVHYRRWLRANGLEKSPSSAWNDRSRSNWHARRARMNGAQDGDRVMLADLLERDRATCSACGEHIDVDIAWPDPFSPSIDHTVPVSRGGQHSMANTTAMHLRCNMVKGARLVAVDGTIHIDGQDH